MLTRSPVLCGRWSARDFLRGRSKRGGAIHTRHTHGSKGRYKRLSTHHGLRDGRRHAGNHMQGGLGVKLGGGLFGLRIPRQHMLSTMTKEAFDIEMFGHPNITNPYRDQLEAHPNLRRVMQNAMLETNVVVLLPRAPRTPPVSSASSSVSASEVSDTPWVPPAWHAVIDTLCEALTRLNKGEATTEADKNKDTHGAHGAPLAHVHVHLATLESSVCAGDVLVDVDAESPDAIRDRLYRSSAELYQRLSKGRILNQPVHSTTSPLSRPATGLSTGRAHGTLLGAALKASPLTTAPWERPHPQRGPDEQSATLSTAARTRAQRKLDVMQCARQADTAVSSLGDSQGRACVGSSLSSSAPCGGLSANILTLPSSLFVNTDAASSSAELTVASGAQKLLRELHRRAPTALCVCARLATAESSMANLSTTTPTASAPRHAAGKPAPQQVHLSETPRPRPVPLFKADVDSDTVVGVWQHAPVSLASLLHWHYKSHDPRAHNGDALPHDKRRLPVLLFLDASKLSMKTSHTYRHRDKGDARDRQALVSSPGSSLMSVPFSEELLASGFHTLPTMTCEALVEELKRWACDAQWLSFAAHKPDLAASSSPDSRSASQQVQSATAEAVAT